MTVLSKHVVAALGEARDKAQSQINRNFMSCGPGESWERWQASSYAKGQYEARDHIDKFLADEGYVRHAGKLIHTSELGPKPVPSVPIDMRDTAYQGPSS